MFILWGHPLDKISSDKILLYTEDNLSYYKIPYDEGTPIFGGATATRCEEKGTKAVCPGQSGCYANDQCMVTSLSKECPLFSPGPLDGLAQKICNTTRGPDCPALEMLTVFYHGYPRGDIYITTSNTYGYTHHEAFPPLMTGGEKKNTYYAYCVECNTCQGL